MNDKSNQLFDFWGLSCSNNITQARILFSGVKNRFMPSDESLVFKDIEVTQTD